MTAGRAAEVEGVSSLDRTGTVQGSDPSMVPVPYRGGVRPLHAVHAVAVTAMLALGAAPSDAQPADAAAALLGGLKGDESTYIAIAASLAYDGDLAFDQRDLARQCHRGGQLREAAGPGGGWLCGAQSGARSHHPDQL